MIMTNKEFQSALKKAYKCEQKLKSACVDLENIFQPYFNDEITVLYQNSDGFVILHDTELSLGRENGYKNTEVKHAFELIKNDKKHFLKL